MTVAPVPSVVDTVVVAFASDSVVVFIVVCSFGVEIVFTVVVPACVVKDSVSVVTVVVCPVGVVTVFVVVFTSIGFGVVVGS